METLYNVAVLFFTYLWMLASSQNDISPHLGTWQVQKLHLNLLIVIKKRHGVYNKEIPCSTLFCPLRGRVVRSSSNIHVFFTALPLIEAISYIVSRSQTLYLPLPATRGGKGLEISREFIKC